MVEQRKPDNKASSQTGTSLVSRNLVVCGRRTTARLEDEMWASFKNIAKSEGCSVNDLASRIDSQRKSGQSLTSAIRLFLMLYYRDGVTDADRAKAGHDGGQKKSVFSYIDGLLSRRRLVTRLLGLGLDAKGKPGAGK